MRKIAIFVLIGILVFNGVAFCVEELTSPLVESLRLTETDLYGFNMVQQTRFFWLPPMFYSEEEFAKKSKLGIQWRESWNNEEKGIALCISYAILDSIPQAKRYCGSSSFLGGGLVRVPPSDTIGDESFKFSGWGAERFRKGRVVVQFHIFYDMRKPAKDIPASWEELRSVREKLITCMTSLLV